MKPTQMSEKQAHALGTSLVATPASEMQSEDSFLKQVMEYAKLRGWRAVHFRPGMMASGRWVTPYSGDGRGFPDTVMVRDTRLIFAELKKDDGEMSPEQIDWMASLWTVGEPELALWTPSKWSRIQETLR